MTVENGLVYFLLVDDLEENLLALEGLLRRDRLVLLKARSGVEALEYLLKFILGSRQLYEKSNPTQAATSYVKKLFNYNGLR